jgi:hypothetical protein
VASSNWILSIPGKHISVYTVAYLTGLAYPRAFIPSNIQSGFCITGLWPVNSDIFTADEFLSSYVMDRPEPAVQESGSDAGPSASTALSSPRSLEEIQPFPKAQPKSVNNKQLKRG